MIWVSRNQIDERGNPIKPNDEWFAGAAKATTVALKEKGNHQAKNNVYGNDEVRRAVEKLFHSKCAYCECDLRRIEWNVEHFRPKGKVRERRDHPGYYWLAYEWTNLYPSCTYCNQHRRDKPVWGISPSGISGGKADQFPLASEATRAMGSKAKLGKEKRLLIDPCSDRPERHLGYDPKGQVYELGRSAKGKKSVEVFNLKLTRLRSARKEKIDAVIELIKMKRAADQAIAESIDAYLQEYFLADNCAFSGAARFVANRPELFGL